MQLESRKSMNQANIKKLIAKPDKTLSKWLDLVRAQIQTARLREVHDKVVLLQGYEQEIITARFIKNFGTN